MGFWDSLISTVQTISGRGLNPKQPQAYSNVWPQWEISTPQYPTPTPYNLANLGYRRNELIFACIQRRKTMVSEPPLRIYSDGSQKTRKEQPDHPLRKLLRKPNSEMVEGEFWSTTEIYTNIAGFCAWEMQFNRMGEPMALWPMRPDWCSFLRGDNQPLRAIRYQPYGLPPIEVPRERILLFQEFDPIFPMLKGLSRTAVAMRVAEVDNAMTDFLKIFFQNGAMIQGLLKTDQYIDKTESERIRALWKEQYGGVQNWSGPVVLGNNADWVKTGMTFREMTADDLDARDETRICSAFEVNPILISAKIGMGTITENNYKEARAGMYEGVIFPRWNWFASQIQEQLLPKFEDNPDQYQCDFDTNKVRALQEDKTKQWERTIKAFEKNLIYRDLALEQMGFEPVDGEAKIFYGDTIQTIRETLTPQTFTEGEGATVGVGVGDRGSGIGAGQTQTVSSATTQQQQIKLQQPPVNPTPHGKSAHPPKLDGMINAEMGAARKLYAKAKAKQVLPIVK